MQKKIKYYETVSPADININVSLLAGILFEFRGASVKIEGDNKYLFDTMGIIGSSIKSDKVLSINQRTGELDFENGYLLHN